MLPNSCSRWQGSTRSISTASPFLLRPRMAEVVAAVVVRGLYAYALAGALFAVVFVIRGVQRVDVQARRASFGFRLLIFPGAAAFWPLLLVRWLHATGEPPADRNPHR